MSTPPPSRYVQPEVSEARVERLWSAVEQRLEPRPARPWRWAVLAVGLSGAALGGFFFFDAAPMESHAANTERAVLADATLSSRGDELSVTLGDGSSVKLGSQSEVRVRGTGSSAVSLVLGRGELSCDVTHREGRSFTVVAGDVEVRVIGTLFSVKRTPGESERVEVSVTRGVVEVRSARRPGTVARVGAGQKWSDEADGRSQGAEPPPPVAELQREDDLERQAPPAPSAAVPAVPGARELFEKAAERRRAGDAASAARAYEELLRLHPGDARGGLAAFELGRLRMDRLGDLPGAITALERAVAMRVGPTFREDALARLVSVYASQANFAACRRARDRYLASYPAGIHAGAVATRCGAAD